MCITIFKTAWSRRGDLGDGRDAERVAEGQEECQRPGLGGASIWRGLIEVGTLR